MWNEQAYLDANLDVAAAVKSGTFATGWAHYQALGKNETRLLIPSKADYAGFNANAYLAANPDVANAVKAGTFMSAWQHYDLYGRQEVQNRTRILIPDGYVSTNQNNVVMFNETGYLAANLDVAQAVKDGIFATGFEHYTKYGKAEGRSQAPSSALYANFNESAYLAANPDVAVAVHTGALLSGWQHYSLYGSTEGRITIPTGYAAFGNVSDGTTFTLTHDTAAGADVMRLTGDMAVRIDFTNTTGQQVKGADLNGNNTIAADGVENNPTILATDPKFAAKGYEIVDAYARNPLNQGDFTNNYLRSINYDGTGYAGDGVHTDGNIFLGGLGADAAYGGIGNDFLAGGSVANTAPANTITNMARDYLSGGRNADFLFSELSALDTTDGDRVTIDGGETADNRVGTNNVLVDAAGTSNDRDWLLVEASDDDEATEITIADNSPVGGVAGSVITTRSGVNQTATLYGIEAVDASGNLYGMLNDVEVKIGGRAVDTRSTAPVSGTENYGIGSTSQLVITGSQSANIVVAGYDNDTVTGAGGNDVLFGGNLDYLLRNQNNKNLVDANGGLDLNVNAVNTVTDGLDDLRGGDDNDAIVAEAASGAVAGNAGFDTLYVTNESVGRVKGTVFDSSYNDTNAQAAALKALSTDQVLRYDLGNANGAQFRDYGGANRGLGIAPVEAATGDQTNYVAALGSKPAATVTTVDALIATGLGVIDYKAAGSNSPELTFTNQQNYQGSTARFDVRGVSADEAAITGGAGGLVDANDDGTLDTATNPAATGSTTKFGNYWTDRNFGQDGQGGNLRNNDQGVGSNDVAYREIGDNAIYTSIANDTLEGRQGDDELGGGKGDDNFIFDFGDNTDIIRRQQDKYDVNGNLGADNIWDTDASGNYLYQQDFRADPSGVTATRLQIDFGSTDLTSPNVTVSEVTLTIKPGQADAIKLDATSLQSTHSITELADAVNTAFSKIDSSISVVASGNSLIVSDALGRDISDTVSEGYSVYLQIGNSKADTTATLNPGGAVIQENDRILFVDYLDRNNNAWVNNANNELANQAQDLVIGTGTTTTLANNQEWRVQFQNLAVGDTVKVNINGTVFSRTVQLGETTDAFVTAFVAQINTATLDLYTAAGNLAAAQDNVNAGFVNESVLVLTQNAIGAGENKVYMNAPDVTITAINGAASSASWALANTSGTSIELLGYDGRNGNINAADVLFLGQTGQATMATSDSTATLQFAKNAGETITGKDATVVLVPRDSSGNVLVGTQFGNGGNAVNLYHAVNGDDQLIGGTGNDTLTGGTGDDRFIGSLGTDVIDGGGNVVAPNGQRITFTDSILLQENDFVSGAKFTIAVDAGLDSTGKGVITAVNGTGATIGTTTFTNIEEIRTASNTAQDTIDYSGLSNSVATATGASANLDAAALVLPTVAATNYNEGTLLNLTLANAGLAFAVDRNNDNDTQDAGEISSNPVAVYGVENVIGGAANDIVNMDKTQAGSANNINLAGEQADITPAGNYTEGRDLVSYNHTTLLADTVVADGLWTIGEIDSRPTLTVTVEAGSNLDTVSATGGAIGTATVVDNLTNVEELDIAAAATNKFGADTLDLSKIAGATVNFGAGAVTVGRTLGGLVAPVNTVAAVEANTFENGGVSVTGGNIGNELIEITGITQIEKITGSAGADRIVIGDGSAFTNVNFNLVNTSNDDQKIAFNFYDQYATATRSYNQNTLVDNRGLYQIDLGAGDNDSLDYRQSNDGIAVNVDFAGTTGDYVAVDEAGAAGFFTNGTKDRIDVAQNVERFYGANNGGNNAIDLSRATEAVTVTFGAEALATTNEVKDPNGIETTADASKTQDNQITGINVSTATNTSVARFMESSVHGDGSDGISPNAAVLWNRIEGSNQNETIILSQYQERLANETFNLRGGNNVVDYTNAIKVGQNDIYTLNVSDFAPVASTTTTHGGYTVVHAGVDGAGTDTITIDRQLDATLANTDGTLKVIGSSNANDVVSIAALAAPTGLNNAAPGINDINGTKKDGTAVAEEANIIDITGTVKGGYNLVDLGSGVGVTSGQVIQDVNMNFKGQTQLNDNVVTSIANFENITGSVNNDRLYGNDSNNTITGGGGRDIYQGRGGGDTINMGADAADERVIYTGPGDTADVSGGTLMAAVGEYDVINTFDTNVAVTDRLVFDLTLAAASGGFNLTANAVQEVDYTAAAAVAANGGIILSHLNGVAADADLLNMTTVAGKLANGGNSFTTAVADGVQAIFAVEGLTQTGIYVWQQADNATELANAVVDANELRLLTVLNGQSVGKIGAEAAGVLTAADLSVVQVGRSTGLADTVLLNAGVQDIMTYTNLTQSQYGQVDTLGKFVAGVVTNGFEVGIDKIDLSAFNLGAADGLAQNAIVTRDRTGAGSQITDANANDFFYDGNNIRRAVVVEYDNDDIDGATAGIQARARVFVDLNGDGQLSTTQDMFIDIATDGTSTNTAVANINTAANGTGFVPGYADFIFKA